MERAHACCTQRSRGTHWPPKCVLGVLTRNTPAESIEARAPLSAKPIQVRVLVGVRARGPDWVWREEGTWWIWECGAGGGGVGWRRMCVGGLD